MKQTNAGFYAIAGDIFCYSGMTYFHFVDDLYHTYSHHECMQAGFSQFVFTHNHSIIFYFIFLK